MTAASFRFSPKILARLGEELNQTADQSIIELVKNAYDADATHCRIELHSVGSPGGSIVVSDDGDGMNVDTIRDRWLVLGKSSKSSENLTASGRTPAGSKGLGRLAALRMGTRVELQSIERGNSRRLHKLEIDWSRFDNANIVEEVPLAIESKKNSRGGHGTKTELSNLRSGVTSEELRRLARSLLLLTDPFAEKGDGFRVSLVSPEFKEIETLIQKKYFDDASFHLQAEVDATGHASARIVDWQLKELARADLATLRYKKKPTPYASPKATFDLWVFLLSGEGEQFSSRKAGKSDLKTWLRTFGGVHVYQGGIRVTPYGNSGNDWLEMNLARTRNPEERPSTNTSIGKIQIAGAGLRQKTDRSGFIEDEQFEGLRTFAQDALGWLARWRLDLAEKRRSKERAEAPKAAAAQKHKMATAIALAPPKARKVLEDAFSGYEKSRDREAESLRKEVQLYRTLSTAGITAATFSHESQGNPLKRIEINLTTIKSRVPRLLKAEKDREKLLGPVNEIEKAATGLSVLGTATLGLVKATKRRVGRVSIHETLNQLINLMQPFIAGMSAGVEVDYCTGNPFLRTSESAIESIFANLVANALAAFERGGTPARKILVSTQLRGTDIEVRVSDSGPGIIDVRISDIWLPGVTARAEGTGLGLTIVRDTVKDIGGEVDAISPGSLGGAEFIVRLPILGS